MKKLIVILAFCVAFLATTKAHAVTCGYTGTVSGSVIPGNNSDNGEAACTPAANSTVQSCVVGVHLTGSGNIACAIYASSGGLETGAPICSSGSQAATGPDADNTITMSGCGTLTAGTLYHIVVNNDSATMAFQLDSTQGGNCSTTATFQTATFPTFVTGGTWAHWASGCERFYLNITASGGGAGATTGGGAKVGGGATIGF